MKGGKTKRPPNKTAFNNWQGIGNRLVMLIDMFCWGNLLVLPHNLTNNM